MKIAILAPSPVPFQPGGAEDLWRGLHNYINDETPHACEVFKLSIQENDLISLVQAYLAFAQHDAHGFDVLISGKYPAWMARHAHHRLYMLHTLRGLYDTYHLCGHGTQTDWPAALEQARAPVEQARQAGPVPQAQIRDFLLQVLYVLQGLEADSPFLDFPGPFSRQLVHFLDSLALSPHQMSGYAAISQTVARRAGYFPPQSKIRIAYPPPSRTGFHCQNDDYLFTASRLDRAKRIDLLIGAMKDVTADIPLLIAGSGPDEERLRELAQDDPRIRFVGRLTEPELLDHYANALAVPFVPYDEDYGLITIEAMKSGKPVITTSDSGGVTEFVHDGQTGLVTPPDPQALAAAMNQMAQHRAQTRHMGETARESVESVTWAQAFAGIMGQDDADTSPLFVDLGAVDLATVDLGAQATPGMKARADHPPHGAQAAPPPRPRMVVATTFGVFPPRGGGQARIFHLYSALARHYDITLLTLGAEGDTRDIALAPGLREVRIGKSVQHQILENELTAQVDGVPITDIAAGMLIDHTPHYAAMARTLGRKADVVVASHPFMVDVLRRTVPQAQLWLEAHNVEVNLKADLLPSNEHGQALVERVRATERTAWTHARLVMACTQTDLDVLAQLYGPTQGHTLVVPNGYSPQEVRFAGQATRDQVKRTLGLSHTPVALFMGSWHGPNLEAVESILQLAPQLPGVTFLVVGSAGLAFQKRDLPPNLRVLGVVDEAEKQALLACTDVALNPMRSGSGSNLKMLDYLAAGVPVISTPFGVRGLDDQIVQCLRQCELEHFVPTLTWTFVEADDTARQAQRRKAHDLAAQNYAWPQIGARMLQAIEAFSPKALRAG